MDGLGAQYDALVEKIVRLETEIEEATKQKDEIWFQLCHQQGAILGLTPKEENILSLLLDEDPDMPNKIIADKLCVSTRTIKFHLTNMLRKAGCSNKKQLLAKAKGMKKS